MNCHSAINHGTTQLYLSTTPRLDAEILLAYVLGVTRSELLINSRNELSPHAFEAFEKIILKRKLGEPVAYLVGYKEFWGLNFKVNSSVLIPRPETEHLVEHAVDFCLSRNFSGLKILELGTGSGCLAIGLAEELKRYHQEFKILAVDLSSEALVIAKENQQELSPDSPIEFIQSDWFSNVGSDKFDLIISNPPYVNPSLPDLSPELAYEPKGALYSDSLGLADIYQIISSASNYLSLAGNLLIEIGSEQRPLLENYLQINYPQAKIDFIPDLAGKDRIIQIKYL